MSTHLDQLQKRLDQLAWQVAEQKIELRRVFEPEKRMRLENEIAETASITARLRRELRAGRSMTTS